MCGTQDASHIGQLGCANCIGGMNVFLRKTNAPSLVNKKSGAYLYNPNQDVRMTMQGDFECLLDDDGFKHIDIQIQRRSERHGRTPGFKDSNLRPDSMMKTSKAETARRNTGLI